MARAGAIVADTLALLEERLEPGITMIELDRIAEEYIRAQGGVPTSKGYKGFPAATCISPNDMIVHGIPGDYQAREGDIVSFDIGVTKDGLIADSAATFARRRDRSRGSAAARRLPGRARGRDRGGSARRRGRRHLRGGPDGDRGGRLLGRAQPRRPRRRPLLPRGSRRCRTSSRPTAGPSSARA